MLCFSGLKCAYTLAHFATSDRISSLWSGTKYDLVDRIQSPPGDWRWWSHAALNDYYLGYRSLERVRILGLQTSIFLS